MALELEKVEVARTLARIRKLGPRGLERAAESLKAARELEQKSLPDSELAFFPIPNPKSKRWMPIQTVQEPTVKSIDNTALAEYLAADGKDLPFFVQYDHIKVGCLIA